MQYAGHNCVDTSLVSGQCLLGVGEVKGLNPIRESDFFLMNIISFTNPGMFALNLELDSYSEKINCYSAV